MPKTNSIENFEINYLTERLTELEYAADNLTFIISNEDSVFHENEVMKDNLAKVLTESAAVRRRLALVK